MSCFPKVESRRFCFCPTQTHQPPVRYLGSHSIGPPYCISSYNPSPPQFVYGGYVSCPWERLSGCPHPFQTNYKQLVYLQVCISSSFLNFNSGFITYIHLRRLVLMKVYGIVSSYNRLTEYGTVGKYWGYLYFSSDSNTGSCTGDPFTHAEL